MKMKFFQSFYSTLHILMQVSGQRFVIDSRSKTDVLMRKSLALQPKHFHFFLYSRMRMVITLVVQLALLFFAELNIDQFITSISNSTTPIIQ